MTTTFEINKSSRNVLLSFLSELSEEQLNFIPDGFKNNIIWNIGHIVVVQQLLVYRLSGLPTMVSDELIAKYRKGSAPTEVIAFNEIEELKKLLFSTLEQAKTDFKNNIFQDYNSFVTMSGFEINSAKAAMEFNNYHEAVHTGIIMQLKKFL